MEVERKILRNLAAKLATPDMIGIEYATLRDILEAAEAAHASLADLGFDWNCDDVGTRNTHMKVRVTRLLDSLDHSIVEANRNMRNEI